MATAFFLVHRKRIVDGTERSLERTHNLDADSESKNTACKRIVSRVAKKQWGNVGMCKWSGPRSARQGSRHLQMPPTTAWLILNISLHFSYFKLSETTRKFVSLSAWVSWNSWQTTLLSSPSWCQWQSDESGQNSAHTWAMKNTKTLSSWGNSPRKWVYCEEVSGQKLYMMATITKPICMDMLENWLWKFWNGWDVNRMKFVPMTTWKCEISLTANYQNDELGEKGQSLALCCLSKFRILVRVKQETCLYLHN